MARFSSGAEPRHPVGKTTRTGAGTAWALVGFALFAVALTARLALPLATAAANSHNNEAFTMRLADGQSVSVEFWDENIVRVIHAPRGGGGLSPSLMVLPDARQRVRWTREETPRGTLLRSQRLAVLVDAQGHVTFVDTTGDVLLAEIDTELSPAVVSGEQVYHVRQSFQLRPDEGIYGLGQHQDGVMNYRDHQVTLVQENREVAVPVLVSSRAWGILWDNYSKTRFEDDAEGMSLWSEVADAVDYYFIAGQNLDEVIAGYRQLTGQAPLLSRWAYGYWQSKERYKTQEEIIQVVREYRRRHVPLDVIVQDWQYWGELGWNAMDFDRRFFPNPKAMLDTIHALNAHYLISVWPVFDSTTAVFKDFKARGLLCRRPDGAVTRLYDAYNPEARALYWRWLDKNLLSLGVDGWWLDATEPEFPGATLDEIAENAKKYGRHYLGTWARYLNAYSLMSTRGVYEHQRAKTESKRVVILTRSAYGGQQRYSAITWSGDISASWEVLRKQISAGLNFCLSGLPYWTMDIGAFIPNNPLGCRDEAYRELYVRWFQFGAFCPIFRSHGTGTPREVWQFGDEGTWAYEALVKSLRLRYRLLPYIYSLAWRVTSQDYTMMRALVFDFPDDPKARDLDDEYMFGPAFLVCPITEKMYFEHTFTGELIPADHLFTADGKRGGLTVEFFNGTSFEKFVTRRTEHHLDFDWNSGIRPEGVNQHYYSIRFTGEILTEEAGEYTFVTTSNDGIRLWIGNELVIDNWTDHGATIDMGTIRLEANRRYPIRMEYYQTLGAAVTRLAWIRPSQSDLTRPQPVPPPKNWSVFLPSHAKWFDFWTGEVYPGGKSVEVPAPIDRMPLFVRAGSIVPMGPVVQYADELPPDPIEIRIYPGDDANFLLYEDEGDGYNYEKGEFATIEFRWDDVRRTLTISERKGEFPGMLRERTFHVVLVRPGHGTGIEPTRRPDRVVSYSGEEIRIPL